MCTLFEEIHALHVGSTLAALWIQFQLVLLYYDCCYHIVMHLLVS